MSNPDSFIDEVTEEMRRDKLYGYLRRYGWIAVVSVIALVGWAAWNEYTKSQARAEAEETGDALLAAMQLEGWEARATAFAEIEAGPDSAAVVALLTAGVQERAEDYAAAAETLASVAADGDVPQIYRDLAVFKAAILPNDDAEAAMLALEQQAQPGQPFRLLALEQIVYRHLEAGETDAALTNLRMIVEDAAVTQGLRQRAQSLMVALGEPLPEEETAPEGE